MEKNSTTAVPVIYLQRGVIFISYYISIALARRCDRHRIRREFACYSPRAESHWYLVVPLTRASVLVRVELTNAFSLSLGLTIPFLPHILDCTAVQHDRDRKAYLLCVPAQCSSRTLWQIHMNIYSEKLECTLTAISNET